MNLCILLQASRNSVGDCLLDVNVRYEFHFAHKRSKVDSSVHVFSKGMCFSHCQAADIVCSGTFNTHTSIHAHLLDDLSRFIEAFNRPSR